jgi:NAD(P)-dependent dehydrogenase (short-subunit alcohol dehydrogenase family)
MSETQQQQQKQTAQTNTESQMNFRPQAEDTKQRGSDKLKNKVALITGGDSGIGRAVAIAYAKEGANVAIVYLQEHDDAKETKQRVEQEDRRCMTISGDIGDENFCRRVVEQTVREFGRLDILVNNAGEQHPQTSLEDITAEQLERTFRTNIFSMFYLTKAALPYLSEGCTIINTTSVTAYKGSPQLIDYSSTKGAIVAFTRSLSQSLIEKGIRVNGVAPGPIWTPLITSTFDRERIEKHGSSVPMHRAGQPEEVAPCYVFLASEDSSYMAGQILHPNGGEVINS